MWHGDLPSLANLMSETDEIISEKKDFPSASGLTWNVLLWLSQSAASLMSPRSVKTASRSVK